MTIRTASQMARQELEAAHEKLLSAESMTDLELVTLDRFYEQLIAHFRKCCPPEYILVRNDVERRHNKVLDMLDARKSK